MLPCMSKEPVGSTPTYWCSDYICLPSRDDQFESDFLFSISYLSHDSYVKSQKNSSYLSQRPVDIPILDLADCGRASLQRRRRVERARSQAANLNSELTRTSQMARRYVPTQSRSA